MTNLSPYKRLALEMIALAVRDAAMDPATPMEVWYRDGALRWAEDGDCGPITLNMASEMAGVDPGYVADRITARIMPLVEYPDET